MSQNKPSPNEAVTPITQRPTSTETSPDVNDAAESAAAKSRTLWREYFESAVVTLVMALFFMTFVAQAAAVPSASMENTILVGDHFLINKFIFAHGSHVPFLPQRDIRRGDIIVFKFPGATQQTIPGQAPEVEQYKTFFIKRVIGMPGETIEVRGAQVLIDGQPLPEHRVTTAERTQRVRGAPLPEASDPPRQNAESPYTVYYDPQTINPPRGIVENVHPTFQYAVGGRPFVIPDDSYFVMGDNRDDSADSRQWGVVQRDLVVGRALFVIWSYDESAPKEGNFLINFFRNTRWKRTGTLIR